MRHPWATFRSRSGYSQQDVADRLDITRHSVLRIEQGVLHPSHYITATMAVLYRVSEEELSKSYFDWIVQHRLKFGEQYENFESLRLYDGLVHPLTHWREYQGLSRIGLCKGLCIGQGPLNEYEHNKRRTLPDDMSEALRQIGWSKEPLIEAVKDWRLSGRADRNT